MSDVLILDSGADKIKIGKGFYSDVIKNDSSGLILPQHPFGLSLVSLQ